MTRLAFYLFALPLLACELPSSTPEHHPVGKFSKRLTLLAEKWEMRLGLTGWKTRVMIVDRSELRPHTLAASFWNTDTREFTICVLSESDYRDIYTSKRFPPTVPGHSEVESSVVHEIVHLSLDRLAPAQASDDTAQGQYSRVEEEAVVRLTRALLTVNN